MNQNSFLRTCSHAAIAIAAALLISSGLTSCKKDRDRDQQELKYDTIIITTDGEINSIQLSFDEKDEPVIKSGAEEKGKPKKEDGWLIKDYSVTSNNIVITGKVTRLKCEGIGAVSLDASDNNELTELHCFANKLTYKTLKLPNKDGAGKGILCFDFKDIEPTHKQYLSPEQVKDIQKLGWEVKRLDGYVLEDYLGENHITIIRENKKLLQLTFSAEDNPIIDGFDGDIVSKDKYWKTIKYDIESEKIILTGEITKLICKETDITYLDISTNTNITVLRCNSTPIKSLDISRNTELKELFCYAALIDSLDLSNNPKLIALSCGGKSLKSLDVSKNTELETLGCNYSQISSLNLSNNTKLKNLFLKLNPNIKSLDVSKNKELETLVCSYSQISSLNLSNNTSLKELKCHRNNLTYQSLVLPNLANPGKLYFKVANEPQETQKLTKDHVGEIKKKNWTVFQYIKNDWATYDGE